MMFVVNFFLFGGSCFSGCPVYCGLWYVRSSGLISSCSQFRFFVHLSTNPFFEGRRISWRCILRAVILRVCLFFIFTETGFNSLSTVISIQPIITGASLHAVTGYKMLSFPFVFPMSRFQGPAFRCDKIVVIVTLPEAIEGIPDKDYNFLGNDKFPNLYKRLLHERELKSGYLERRIIE